MAFPSPRINIPRNEVHQAVEFILMNPEVGDVRCLEQPDGTYNVRPLRRVTQQQDED
jgi:hypothetical protein